MAIKRKVGIPYLAFVYDPISYILPKVYSKSLLAAFFPLLIPLGKKLDQKILRESLVSSVPKGCIMTQLFPRLNIFPI